MLRITLATLLAPMRRALACASQPICPPWSPATAPASTAAAPAATNDTTAPPVDDGTVALTAASPDSAWTDVVGVAPMHAPAPAADAAAPDRAALAPTLDGSPRPAARKKARKAVAAAEPAPTAAKPATAAPATKPAQAVPAPDAGALKEARAFFAGRCQMCHGDGGRGDGPAGKALTPQPRNFPDRGWQRQVSDGHIEKVILQGGVSVGKSPLMPAHTDLAGKPAVVKALIGLVRGFGR